MTRHNRSEGNLHRRENPPFIYVHTQLLLERYDKINKELKKESWERKRRKSGELLL